MMFSVVMILIFPAFGLISDRLGMGSTFLMLGGVMLVMSFVNLKVVRSNGRKACVKEEKTEPARPTPQME